MWIYSVQTRIALTKFFVLCSFIATASLFSACNKASTPPALPAQEAVSSINPIAKPTTAPVELLKYSNDGLSLKYPTHWKLAYDEAPALYASRGVGFDATDFSAANVCISDQPDEPLEKLTERFLKEFKLDSNNSVKDFKRDSVTLAGFKGEALTWTDTEICCSDIEVTLFEIQSEPKSIFVAFILSEDDIKTEGIYKSAFLNSIKLR